MSTPTDEQVEVAAKALYEAHCARGDDKWEGLSHGTREHYRKDARAALVAAAGGATQESALDEDCSCICEHLYHVECRDRCVPAPAAPVVDESKLAEVIAGTDSMIRVWFDLDDLGRESARIARAVAEWLRGDAS